MRFVNSGVAGRRAGVGAVAVVVAGVVTASVGVGDAFAMYSRPGGHSGHSRAGRSVSDAQYRAKIEMLGAARFQAKGDIEKIWSSEDTSPARLGYTMVPGVRGVEKAWHDFQKLSTEEQNNSYPVVIAYKPGEHKEASFLIPGEHEERGDELYLTDQGEELTFGGLQGRWNSPGWSFYVKHVNRPIQSDTWWPADNHGKTRKRFDAILESTIIRAQILRFLYLPENHERKFTVREIIDEMNHPHYHSDNERNRTSVTNALVDLHAAEVIATRSEYHPGSYGKSGYHRALTKDEILAKDNMSITDRVQRFLRDHKGLSRDVLHHMYENPGKQFNSEILTHEFPGESPENPAAVADFLRKRKDIMRNTLNDLKFFGLIELVEPGVRGRGATGGKYQAFPLSGR